MLAIGSQGGTYHSQLGTLEYVLLEEHSLKLVGRCLQEHTFLSVNPEGRALLPNDSHRESQRLAA